MNKFINIKNKTIMKKNLNLNAIKSLQKLNDSKLEIIKGGFSGFESLAEESEGSKRRDVESQCCDSNKQDR